MSVEPAKFLIVLVASLSGCSPSAEGRYPEGFVRHQIEDFPLHSGNLSMTRPSDSAWRGWFSGYDDKIITPVDNRFVDTAFFREEAAIAIALVARDDVGIEVSAIVVTLRASEGVRKRPTESSLIRLGGDGKHRDIYVYGPVPWAPESDWHAWFKTDAEDDGVDIARCYVLAIMSPVDRTLILELRESGSETLVADLGFLESDVAISGSSGR